MTLTADASPPVRNNRELFVFGMKRTGNHGIIGWLSFLFPEPVYFINNVRHFTDPFAKNHEFRRYRALNVVDLHKKRYPDTTFSTDIRLAEKKTLLLSYEDVPLDALAERPIIEDKVAKLGASAHSTTILLLRDHYNLIASRMQMYRKEGSPVSVKRMKRDLDLWKVYAREFLGETSYLGDGLLRISYNNWFSSKPYRQLLATQLDLPFSDEGLEILPPQGSSFDSKELLGGAQRMAVLERWKAFKDDPIYEEAVRDVEAAELNERLFGTRAEL